MPKVKISEFNSNPALNTDIDSINIAEGCSPSGINDAIRELMSQLKDWQSGTSNDPMVIGSSGSLTLNQGTANGVAYLNGSKVVTSGSALTFDGTNLGVTGNTSTTVQASSRNDNGTTNAGAKLATLYTSTEITSLGHYWDGSQFLGKVNFLSDLLFTRNNSEQMRLTSTGLGIGTSSPASLTKLTVYQDSTYAVQLMNSSQNYTLRVDSGVSNALILGNRTSFSDLLTVSTSGNLGLGVTPSAWSGAPALDIGSWAAIAGVSGTSAVAVTSNAYYNSGWKYKLGFGLKPALYQAVDGSHAWYTAPSGTAGNAITFTQAMSLTASGQLLVGQTATGLQTSRSFSWQGSGEASFYVSHSTSDGNGDPYMRFGYNGSQIGSITQNGTTGVLYNLTSDYRLKNNPVTLTGSGAFIDSLQPKTWDWWDGSGKGVGFIAHEFMEVAKYSGNGEKDAVDAEGKPVYQSIQPSSSEVMANLVAEIQSLRKRLADAGL